jgi:hypothetical protein
MVNLAVRQRPLELLNAGVCNSGAAKRQLSEIGQTFEVFQSSIGHLRKAIPHWTLHLWFTIYLPLAPGSVDHPNVE